MICNHHSFIRFLTLLRILFGTVLYCQQKESAHWLEAAEVKKGEPPLPQHNMLLSVLVCSGGRLAATAVVGLSTWSCMTNLVCAML